MTENEKQALRSSMAGKKTSKIIAQESKLLIKSFNMDLRKSPRKRGQL